MELRERHECEYLMFLIFILPLNYYSNLVSLGLTLIQETDIIRKTGGREGQRRRFGGLGPSPIDFSSNFSPETVTFIDKMPTSKFGL